MRVCVDLCQLLPPRARPPPPSSSCLLAPAFFHFLSAPPSSPCAGLQRPPRAPCLLSLACTPSPALSIRLLPLPLLLPLPHTVHSTVTCCHLHPHSTFSVFHTCPLPSISSLCLSVCLYLCVCLPHPSPNAFISKSLFVLPSIRTSPPPPPPPPTQGSQTGPSAEWFSSLAMA